MNKEVKNKIVEVRSKTEKELLSELADLKKEAMNFRFQKSTGVKTNVARIKQVRRQVARVKTVLNERIKLSEKNA